LTDSGRDILSGFSLAGGQPVGGAGFSAAEYVAAFIFKDKRGLGSTAIDTEIDH
jgi:hypothetical protein